MKEEILCFCGCLNCNPLPFQILKRLDFAFGFYNHHLTAVQVWSCPLIFVFSSVLGLTAPQTVDGSICKGWRFAKCIERNRHVADCVVLGGRRFLLCASAEQQERRKEKRKDFFHE